MLAIYFLSDSQEIQLLPGLADFIGGSIAFVGLAVCVLAWRSIGAANQQIDYLKSEYRKLPLRNAAKHWDLPSVRPFGDAGHDGLFRRPGRAFGRLLPIPVTCLWLIILGFEIVDKFG